MKKIRRPLNLVMAVIIMIQWLRMAYFQSGSALTGTGLHSLKYFTILSNLLEAFACFLFAAGKGDRLKYTAAVCLGLTFLVVLVFLGPVFGYALMFLGMNLWFHLLVPLFAMGEFILCNQERKTAKDAMTAVLPMAVYGFFYCVNNLVNGPHGSYPFSNDWYHFMTWGLPWGIMIYFLIMAVTYAIGLFLGKMNGMVRKHQKEGMH